MPSTDKNEPPTYRVICISIYVEDLKALDELVLTLKSRGMTKANRSSLIRLALANLAVSDIVTTSA